MDYAKFLKQFKKLKEQTTRYTPPNVQGDRGDYMGSYDTYVDFPYVEDPSGYQTYRPLEQSADGRTLGEPPKMQTKLASEQEAAISPDAAGAEAGAAAGAEMGAAAGEEAGADVASDAEGGLPADMATGDVTGLGGVGALGGMQQQEQQPLTSNQIGRVYELKKIYSRLSSVESYLARATDQSILELRKYVSQSIDLFEIVISNYEQFKDKVDDIIVQYYEFLDEIYSSLRKYYKEMSD